MKVRDNETTAHNGLTKPHWLGTDNHYHRCPYCGEISFFFYKNMPDKCPVCDGALHVYTPEEALSEIVQNQ